MDYSVSGKKWQGIYYNPLEGNIYLVYKRYILPIGQLYKYKYIRYLSLFTKTWNICWNYAGFVWRSDSQGSLLHKTPTQTMQYFATKSPENYHQHVHHIANDPLQNGRPWMIYCSRMKIHHQPNSSWWWFERCFLWSSPVLGIYNPIWRAHFSDELKPHEEYEKKELGNLWSAGHALVGPVFSNQQLEGRFQLVSIELLVIKPTSCRTLSELSVLFACWVLGARRR